MDATAENARIRRFAHRRARRGRSTVRLICGGRSSDELYAEVLTSAPSLR
jgi:hypothetical protein